MGAREHEGTTAPQHECVSERATRHDNPTENPRECGGTVISTYVSESTIIVEASPSSEREFPIRAAATSATAKLMKETNATLSKN